jgi:hypothetical protein
MKAFVPNNNINSNKSNDDSNKKIDTHIDIIIVMIIVKWNEQWLNTRKGQGVSHIRKRNMKLLNLLSKG